MTSTQFAILGAGPAGLGAAYRLASRGFQVVVLERAERVGGLASSFEVAGQRVDHGSHRLHTATPPEALESLRAVLGDELQLRRRRGRIRLQGRWLRFPLKATDAARSLPPRFLVKAGMSAVGASLRPRRDSTFAEYVTTGLGRAMGEAFYFPYARKIWGADASQISGAQARRRISADSPLKLARRVTASEQSAGRFFYYPAGGFGRIAEALSDAATDSGVDIRLGAEVAAIDIAGARPGVVMADGSRVEADQVWSTLPITRLVDMVQPPDEAAASAARALEFRSMLLVYLAVPVERYTEFDAHYFPESDVAMTRISEPKNYRDGSDPDGVTVLCAEIPCSEGDEYWALPDADLGDLVADDLERCGLPRPRPTEVVVRRVAHAYPIYRVGHEPALDTLMDWAARQPNLIALGRQGLFAHDNTHHALAMAWAAADAVDDAGAFDEQQWERALEQFQSHVVED